MNNISKNFSKAPSILTAMTCVASLAMLITLLLFQGGILYSLGLTMLTSDILVMAITIVLAICAVLSMIAMIRSIVGNKKNKKLIKNILADISNGNTITAAINETKTGKETKAETPAVNNETKDDDEEPEEAINNNESVAEVPQNSVQEAAVKDEKPSETTTAEDYESLASILEGNKKPSEVPAPPVITAPNVALTHEITHNQKTNDDVVTETKQEPTEQNNIHDTETHEEPVQDTLESITEEAQEPVAEPVQEAESKPSQDENTESTASDDQPVELTKFEHSMVTLMKRGNIPESIYAIEEYRENAVCLTHDDKHYFVYICKDNDAKDVECFPIYAEKETAMAFATRIRNKLSETKQSA